MNGALIWLQAQVHLLAVGNPNGDTNCGAGGTVCQTGLPSVSASNSQLQTLLQITFGILAGIAVLMIVIGALRYVISEGNPESTKKARATIIYAVVGLVICISAEAVVAFALSNAP